jgi:hypothetical protein
MGVHTGEETLQEVAMSQRTHHRTRLSDREP